MAPELEFYPLADKPEFLEQLATWNHNQWGYFRPNETIQFSRNLFTERLNRDHLPITYVALLNGQPVGMFSLITDIYEMGYPNTPMLNNVYVDKQHRKKGIGKAMVAHAEQVASELGFENIFLFTGEKSLNKFYKSIQWEKTGSGKFLGDHDIWFFEKNIAPAPISRPR